MNNSVWLLGKFKILWVCVSEHVCVGVCVCAQTCYDKVKEVITGNVVQEPKTRVTKDFICSHGLNCFLQNEAEVLTMRTHKCELIQK